MKDTARYNEDNHEFIIPSLALKCEHTIKKVTTATKDYVAEKDDTDLSNQIQTFMETVFIKIITDSLSTL